MSIEVRVAKATKAEIGKCARCGHGRIDHDGDPGPGVDMGCLESDPGFPELKCECAAYVPPKEGGP